MKRRDFLRGSGATAAAIAGAGPAAPQPVEPPEVIDAHAHLPLARFGGPLAGRFSQPPTGDGPETEFARRLAEGLSAPDLEPIARLRLSELDRLGVSRSVLMPIDFGPPAEGEDRHWEETEAIAAVARRWPERFIAFIGLDPRRGPEGLARVERAARTLGVRGVKLHPLAGFFPDDRPTCYPLYDLCVELDLAVTGHCRPLGLGPRDEASRPERYARVAADFPRLRLCLGHCGGAPWREAALGVLEAHPNAYGDLSTHQRFHAEAPATFGDFLRRALNGPARERVMYGTDWPTVRELDARWIQALRGEGTAGEPPLAEADRRALLSANACRFLAL